ncbi:hypothetical protein SELMODRAFT_416679 [Selaginella moellendorffii]|uniref:Uncharacterized protein n=1 Tax=Selaginella moellendorffii TaxID=88036 RepID=D8S025_SELML|nr:hypothetical protein SELMODRAFT_416679 [Selaginella moellendorffii]
MQIDKRVQDEVSQRIYEKYEYAKIWRNRVSTGNILLAAPTKAFKYNALEWIVSYEDYRGMPMGMVAKDAAECDIRDFGGTLEIVLLKAEPSDAHSQIGSSDTIHQTVPSSNQAVPSSNQVVQSFIQAVVTANVDLRYLVSLRRLSSELQKLQKDPAFSADVMGTLTKLQSLNLLDANLANFVEIDDYLTRYSHHSLQKDLAKDISLANELTIIYPDGAYNLLSKYFCATVAVVKATATRKNINFTCMDQGNYLLN